MLNSMKRSIVLSLCLFVAFAMKAQDKEKDSKKSKDVSFSIIEDVPVYPGCRGNTKALKKCLNQKVQQHFAMKFDGNLFNTLGLPSGSNRMLMIFKIDKNGVVGDIQVKAPHPKLAEEAERVLKLLPKFMPGKQRGIPVGVKYTFPMRFNVRGKAKD